MIINENQSYDADYLGDTFKVGTSGNKLTLPEDLSQADIDAIELHINEMTKAEREIANADKEFNREIDAELAQIDLQSIRALREYIAAQPDSPQFIKDHEASANAKRATRRV